MKKFYGQENHPLSNEIIFDYEYAVSAFVLMKREALSKLRYKIKNLLTEENHLEVELMFAEKAYEKIVESREKIDDRPILDPDFSSERPIIRNKKNPLIGTKEFKENRRLGSLEEALKKGL